MKTFRIILMGILISLVLYATADAAIKPGNEMSVEGAKSTAMRKIANPFGEITGTLDYGDRVTILEAPSGQSWVRVRRNSDRREGWIRADILTSKKIVLTAGGATGTSVSSGELAIAGKGFNKEVEGNFKAQHKDIDFTWVDRMTTFKYDAKTLAKFLTDGGLNAGQGGAQ